MKSFKRIIIIIVAIISLSLLSSCKIVDEQGNDEEYKLIYKTEGNGFIVCEYDSNARIKAGTEVELSAFANTGSEFVAWYDEDNNVLNNNAIIKITINEKTVVYAKFKLSDGGEKPIEEDKHDKLADIEEGKEAFIKATIIVTFRNGFVIKDASGFGLVYLGASYDYTCGDIIEFKTTPTTYKGNIQIPELIDCKRVGYEVGSLPIDMIEIDVEALQNNPKYGIHVDFYASVVESGSYLDLQVAGYYDYLYPYNYDENIFHLKNLVGKTVHVCGYLWGMATSKNPYVILESVEEVGTIEKDSTIIAYFNDDWTNPFITIDNYNSYPMTKVDDHYEYEVDDDIETVIFKSGDKKTETLDFDKDSYTFVLGNLRYNGLYDGYFTDADAAFNDVIKISALELNDLHGYIEQIDGMNGISNAAYLINQIRNEDNLDNVVLVGNGDMFQGTALSNLTRGASVVDIMNAMEFDFMGIGNHEFDWGLEEIFKFFDGDKSNGEANFPLINSNVYFKDTNTVVLIDGHNILESTIIEKEGVKIGVVSCIGMLKSSILATRTEDYEFENIISTATPLCKDLRDKGADIILLNIHDGSSSTVSDYTTNVSLASIQYKGKNLIDLIVNGHTHTNQFGYVERKGADLPITQAASYCKYVGELNLYFDKTKNEVIYTHVRTHNLQYEVGTNYDSQIQALVNQKYNDVKIQIEETYCTATASVNQKNQLFDWAANVMLTSVGADCAISNTGGIRSTGRIEKNMPIQLGNMFEIIPFDNEIILCTVSGSVLKNYLNSTSNYYGLKGNVSVSSLSNSKMYKVAVIDYVYYGSYFMANTNPVNTHVIYRDALIEDLKLRSTFNVNTDKTAVVGLLYNGD